MALVLLAACACQDREPPARVVLERFPCLGVCPSYRLAVGADGTVEYDGLGYVNTVLMSSPPTRRRETTRLRAEDTEAVFAAFDRTWSTWWPNQYRPTLMTCPGAGTDAPTLVVVREWPVRRDTLKVYYGCPYVPRRIHRLGMYIDSVVGVQRWLGPVPPR